MAKLNDIGVPGISSEVLRPVRRLTMDFPANPVKDQVFTSTYVDCYGEHRLTWRFTGVAWVKVS